MRPIRLFFSSLQAGEEEARHWIQRVEGAADLLAAEEELRLREEEGELQGLAEVEVYP